MCTCRYIYTHRYTHNTHTNTRTPHTPTHTQHTTHTSKHINSLFLTHINSHKCSLTLTHQMHAYTACLRESCYFETDIKTNNINL